MYYARGGVAKTGRNWTGEGSGLTTNYVFQNIVFGEENTHIEVMDFGRHWKRYRHSFMDGPLS